MNPFRTFRSPGVAHRWKRNICFGENPSNPSRFLLKQTILFFETFELLCLGRPRRTVHLLFGVDRDYDDFL